MYTYIYIHIYTHTSSWNQKIIDVKWCPEMLCQIVSDLQDPHWIIFGKGGVKTCYSIFRGIVRSDNILENLRTSWKKILNIHCGIITIYNY